MDTISLIFNELLEILKRLYSLGPSLADWATVAGVVMIFFGIIAIRSNNLKKRMELMSKIYDRFLEDDIYAFYIRIHNKEFVNWQEDKNDERLLNKSLTLFDEVDYLQIHGLLDMKAWEFLASEIQYVGLNASVWDYMIHRTRDCMDRGFPEEIIPFTGFPELLNKMPEKFRAKPFPSVPDRYNALFNASASSRSSWRLGGWQRLWVVISVILLVIFCPFAYKFQKNLDRVEDVEILQRLNKDAVFKTEIPGIGIVEFPNDMEQKDIDRIVKNNFNNVTQNQIPIVARELT